MKKYVKQSGNPSNDGLYDTNKGTMLWYMNDWHSYYSHNGTFSRVRAESNLPKYYYEELKED